MIYHAFTNRLNKGSELRKRSFALFIFLLSISMGSFAQGTVSWGTYYGGTAGDGEGGVVTDASGNVYLAGNTSSLTGISSGGFQNVFGGGGTDAYIVKFDAAGNRLWATYYGGTGDEDVRGMSIDASGNIYVGGYTTSTNAIASGGFQNTIGGGTGDAFLVKFNSAGARIWGTYYGGALDDQGWGVETDPAGNVYLGGFTTSTTGIASGGFQNALAGGYDAFLVKFNSAGARIWGTYYGGTLEDRSWGLTTDASNNVFLAGYTKSTTGIASGGFQNVYGGNPYDAFLVKFDAAGNRIWGTYFGSTGDDRAFGVATDAAGNIYIGGETSSSLGISSGGFQNTFGGGTWDCILVKFNAAGNRLWATYYGGGGSDWATGVQTDAFGNIYLAGVTGSGANIASGGAQNSFGGGSYDDFLVDFNTLGNRMCATYIGGTGIDYTYYGNLATDASGNVYLTGYTPSTTNIASGGFQNTLGGGSDAYLVKYISCNVPLSVTAVSTNILCNGSCTATATASPAGGTPVYSYSWTGGQTTQTATGLCAGTYTITITDVALNTSTATVTITQPTALTSSISSQNNVLCNGNTNGSASISPSGGTPSYTYSWAPSGGTNSSAGNLSAGNYSVFITDANGCTLVQPVTITQPSPLTVSSASTADSCGNSNGTAGVTSSGGTSPYTYLWSNSATTQNISNLSSGTYSVTTTDANGCSSNTSITVGTIACMSNACCSWVQKANFGGVPRWGVAAFSIGTKGYVGTGDDGSLHNDFWEWDQSTNVWTQKANFGGTARYYAVGMSIGNKGYIGTGYDITNNYMNDFWEYDPSANTWTQKANFGGQPRLDAVAFSIGNRGYLGTGDNPTYFNDFWEYNPGTNTWTQKANFGGTARAAASAFSIGNKGYIGTGWDVNSNYKNDLWEYDQASNSWTQKAAMPGPARVDAVGFAMNGKGYIGTGYAPTYLADFYEYDPSSNTWLQICNFGGTARWGAEGFSIGTNGYVAVGIDGNGYNNELWELSTGTITASVTGAATVCAGNNATLTASGGVTYSWNTGATTSAITVNPTITTTYTVIVSNGNCSDTTNATITVSPVPVATITGSTTFCAGSQTTLTAGGGGAYSWSNSATTSTITVSPTATTTYSVFVSQNSCADTAQIILTPAPSPTANVTGVNILCNGNNNGSAISNPTGGTSPYTYNWSNTQTTNSISNLSAGTYSVLITDANGCSDTQTVVITQPNAITSVSSGTGTSCGNSNGSATVNASGGTGNLAYSWAPSGSTSSTVSGLNSGTYTVFITDANGCTHIDSASIAPSSNPTLSLQSQQNVLCFGSNTGSAIMVAASGMGPYTYAWSPSGGTNANVTGLSANTYTCTVTDAGGCTQTQTVTITQGAAISIITSSVPGTCAGNDGSATANASGGTAPYTYSWNNAQTTQNISGLSGGTYTVVVTDANGCTQTQTIVVNQTAGPTATANASLTSIIIGNTSQLTATGGGNYSWYPAADLSCSTCSNPVASPTQTTTYCVQVTDTNGCTDVSCVTIDVETPCVMQSLKTLLPNVFSPVSTAGNDKYCVPPNACILTFTIKVFDRWGEKVFESSDLATCWDGSMNGHPLNTGVFVYFFQAQLSNGDSFSQKGNISLIR